MLNLRKLTPANEKLDDNLEISIKEAITFMAPNLVQMTRRGFTSKELADGLANQGIVIKSSTLNRYLNKFLSVKKDSEKSEADSKPGDSKEDKPKSDDKLNASSSRRQSEASRNITDKAKSQSRQGNDDSAEAKGQNDRPGLSPIDTPENPKSLYENPDPDTTAANEKSDSLDDFQNSMYGQPSQGPQE